MRTPLDALIITDGNREGFQRVIDVTQATEPQKIFIVGPKGSGKSTVLRARMLDRDLLSTKHVTFKSCEAIVDAILGSAFDEDMDALGTTNVLLLDDFEGFFKLDEKIGPAAAQALLDFRAERGADTVITSTKAISEYENLSEELADILSEFDEIKIESLDGEDTLALIKSFVETYADMDTTPVLTEDAINYIANELDTPTGMKAKAVDYLMTQYTGEPGAELDAESVKAILA